MIEKIPETFWKRNDITILDPCCGCGNFSIVIYKKVRQYHSKEFILKNILYFNDINEDRLSIMNEVFNFKHMNVSKDDFTTFETIRKFDLIVANPPYTKLLPNGKRASKNHNMIGSFISKSLDILKPKGFLLYITPDNWMSIVDRNILIMKLTSLQIHYINIHVVKKYFNKVGSSFVWFLIENTPFYKDIEIEGIWKKTVYTTLL